MVEIVKNIVISREPRAINHLVAQIQRGEEHLAERENTT
jgi:hypothetical protein